MSQISPSGGHFWTTCRPEVTAAKGAFVHGRLAELVPAGSRYCRYQAR